MLHVMSARCLERDLHTIAPRSLECRRQFAAQWGVHRDTGCDILVMLFQTTGQYIQTQAVILCLCCYNWPVHTDTGCDIVVMLLPTSGQYIQTQAVILLLCCYQQVASTYRHRLWYCCYVVTNKWPVHTDTGCDIVVMLLPTSGQYIQTQAVILLLCCYQQVASAYRHRLWYCYVVTNKWPVHTDTVSDIVVMLLPTSGQYIQTQAVILLLCCYQQVARTYRHRLWYCCYVVTNKWPVHADTGSDIVVMLLQTTGPYIQTQSVILWLCCYLRTTGLYI